MQHSMLQTRQLKRIRHQALQQQRQQQAVVVVARSQTTLGKVAQASM
jgi:hypothetical protein